MAIKSVLDPDMPFASADRAKRQQSVPSPEFHAWKQNPSPETSAAFLKSINPILDTAMTSFGGGSAQSPVLRSRAKLMALQAAKTYDPEKGTLRTHLLSHLRGLQRVSGQQQQIISLPERVAIERKHLIDAEDQLRDQFGRDPSDLEIADATGLSLKRLAYIRQAQPAIAEGTMSRTDAAGNLVEPATQATPAEGWTDFVYYDLSPTDQLIMDYSLGRNGSPKLPLSDVASRLGLTPSAISQRAARIQSMLDEQKELIGS